MKVSYKGTDNVEIVELVNKSTKRPLITVFLVNRKFGHAYEHRIPASKEIDFIAEYVRCPNPHVAAGYELATAQHGRAIDITKVPAHLRVAIMNCLPELPCKPSTPSPAEHMGGSQMFSSPSSTTKNFPLDGKG